MCIVMSRSPPIRPATITLTHQDWTFYNAYFKYVRPVLADLCVLTYETTAKYDSDLEREQKATGGLKKPMAYHLDSFLLSGSTGFTMEEMSNIVPRTLNKYCNIQKQYCIRTRSVREYVCTSSATLNMSNEERQNVSRFICNDIETAKANYIPPTTKNVVGVEKTF